MITILRKLTQVKAKKLVFIEENDERGFNSNSFVVYPAGGTLGDHWADVPGFFHQKGTNMSFADGHAEYRMWGEATTFKVTRETLAVANSKDLAELQRAVYGP
jgi:prepilin-type processing-associated H-X9-DG protein